MTARHVWKRRQRIRRELLAAEGHCFYCGWDLRANAWAATLDHVEPQIRGGGEDRSNFKLCCWRCNQTKCDRPIECVLLHVRSRCMMQREEQANVLRRLIRNGETIIAVGDDHLQPRKPRRRRADGTVMPYR